MDRIHVMNLVTSYQLGKISRRQFVQRTSLALGSMSLANTLLAACATVPPNAPASTPITPTNTSAAEAAPVAGIVTEDISYLNGTLTATIARPAEGAAPAVIVIQEWWGLNEHIRDITRRFADAGFAALAPDLYHGAIATEPDEARKLVMELDMTSRSRAAVRRRAPRASRGAGCRRPALAPRRARRPRRSRRPARRFPARRCAA